MSFQGKLRQYLLITEMLQHQPNQTLKDIQNMLYDKGFNLSERTLQRNIESLRDEFGIEIVCNRSFNTYYIDDKEKTFNIDVFIKFLHSALKAQFVSENIKDFKNISEFIHLSEVTNTEGLEYLEPLLNAIKKSKVISFTHENYTTFQHKEYIIEPYLLKEYLNRWYIVGFVKNIKEFRTFGIDRMSDLKITNIKFKRNQNNNPRNFFDNTIGLVYSTHKLQNVKIKTTEIQAKYMRSQPLHSSQIEIENCLFQLTLTPNYELIQRVLMMGTEVMVVEPQWLKDEIKELLEEALKMYK